MANRGADEAAEILVRRYRPVLEQRAKQLYAPGTVTDDLVQEGLISLCSAITKFRSGGSCGFRTFAEICALRRMFSAVSAGRSTAHVILNGALPLDSPEVEQRASVEISAPVDLFDGVKLTELERQVVRLIVRGYTYREIGLKLGCSRKRVDNAMQRVRKKLSSARIYT